MEVAKGDRENLGFSGQTFFDYQGASDIFATMKTFKTALENNDTTAIASSLDALNKGVDVVANDLSAVGTYNNMVTNDTNTLNTANTSLQTTMSNITDVDVAQAYSDFTTLSTSYEASLSMLSKMQQMNVLDYLK